MEWDLKDGFYERLTGAWHNTQLQLMFRTRRSSGLLFKAQNADKSHYLLLEVNSLIITMPNTRYCIIVIIAFSRDLRC